MGPEEAMKMSKGLEHLCYTDRLRELGESSLEKAPGRPHFSLQHLKGAFKRDGERLFIQADSDSTRGNDFKLSQSLN